MNLTFDLWPTKSIGSISSLWLTCLPSLMKKHTCSGLHRVRMMFGVSSIVPNINTERVKGILWHSGHEINMRSTCSPSTTSGDRGLGKTVTSRQTAEHLRLPLLFARDNPRCNDLYTLCLKYRRMYFKKQFKMTKAFFLQKFSRLLSSKKFDDKYTISVLSLNFLLEKGHGGIIKIMSLLFYTCTREQIYPI